ncbi:MAG TPA: lipase maturation factor family protein [Polyangiales bacterium]|nr:lipase maturation factor family protein [Polyangiales bacterium]
MSDSQRSDVEAPEERALLRSLRGDFWAPDEPRYWLTRFALLRALGFIYFVAFLVLWNQMLPLFGSRGLLPADRFVQRLRDESAFWQLPTLFYWGVSDNTLRIAAGLGLGLSFAVMCGVEHAAVMAVLWLVYLSFVHIGQDFYGYGWEILLLEAGFLACFLAPLRSILPLAAARPVAQPVIWLQRWLVFRVMFGAGMIKIRGDPCWRDLTCLVYHYETQPNPHPLSWLLHQAPVWFHQLGVAFNHFVELVVPFFVFGPTRLRRAAGAFIVAFQVMLISSGNLSFLNWLTIAVALACFDDGWMARIVPRALVRRAEQLEARKLPIGLPQRVLVSVLCAFVVVASYGPVTNMLSRRQQMNTSFEPLHLVNSYGAFGSVGKTRDEIILEGTRDDPTKPGARWLPYEFKCKPGDVERRPCWITPYHLRLDWQMWFAALGDYESEPWILHLVYQLLHNDPGALSLLANQPFPGEPPRFIRAERYRYRFTHFGEGDAWWSRERLDAYLPPLTKHDVAFRQMLAAYGWLRR